MVPRATTDQRVARQPQAAAARFTARAYLPRRPVCWTRRLGGRPSVGDEDLLQRHADISGDLAKQCRGDVTTRMKRDRRDPAIRVAELLVRAAAHHPRAASRSPRGGSPPTRDCPHPGCCLLYTSDAADDLLCVDLGGRRIIQK